LNLSSENLVSKFSFTFNLYHCEEAGLEVERGSTVAQIKALTTKIAELSAKLSEERKKRVTLFGGMF
jgi:glycyl-tRNA synthetase alpha subunit